MLLQVAPCADLPVFVSLNETVRSMLQNVFLANSWGCQLLAEDLLAPEEEKEYLEFGCVRQPGLCRTWNAFPQVLWVSKELKYFDTNLL